MKFSTFTYILVKFIFISIGVFVFVVEQIAQKPFD